MLFGVISILFDYVFELKVVMYYVLIVGGKWMWFLLVYLMGNMLDLFCID